MSTADQAVFDPLATSLRGYLIAQITLGLLGGLVITSEYGARTIVSTLVSVPHRGRVLASKAVVLVAVAFPTGLVVSLTGFLVGQAALSGAGCSASGAVRRHGAARRLRRWALSRTRRAVRTRPGGGDPLHHGDGDHVVRGDAHRPGVRPGAARRTRRLGVDVLAADRRSGQIITAYQDPDLLTPWAGLCVMAGCVAVMMGAAHAVFRKRDA
ncbi:hypothetical protein R2F25_00880 [Streptomyces sp. UP1A-1]|nr:hypothetical protein [Streptomyces sp. UP1A-1]